jgi:hypothetical protein
MAKRSTKQRSIGSDNVADEKYSGALKEDLLENARRARPLASLENKRRLQLLKMLGVDVKKAAQAREKDYTAAIASATQRLKRLLAKREKDRRSNPPLMKQVETAMGLRGR